MLAEYLSFARAHPRPLLSAFLLCALSSFGQTFFVALSNEPVRREFGISDGALGGAYAVATIGSGPTLGWAGRWIDRLPLAEELGWDLGMVATAFAGFAAARALAMLRAGPMIDRTGVTRLLPFFLLPLAGAMAALLVGGGRPAAAFGHLLATGLTAGVATTLNTALWAELYGAGRVGAVRAAVAGAALMSSRSRRRSSARCWTSA